MGAQLHCACYYRQLTQWNSSFARTASSGSALSAAPMHAATGGSEAQCQCFREDSEPIDTPIAKPDEDREDEETDKRKRGEAMHASSVQADAARHGAVLRWSKLFREELGLRGFPGNVSYIAYLTAYEIYKKLGLDHSSERKRYIDNAVEIQRADRARKSAWTVQQAMIKYRNRPPQYFNPFSVDCLEDTEPGDKDRIWWLMTDDQKATIIRDESSAGYDIRHKAENAWYIKCMRIIDGGKEAIRNNERLNNGKRSVTNYLIQAQSNVRRKLSTEEKHEITRNECGNLDDLDFDIDAESF